MLYNVSLLLHNDKIGFATRKPRYFWTRCDWCRIKISKIASM